MNTHKPSHSRNTQKANNVMMILFFIIATAFGCVDSANVECHKFLRFECTIAHQHAAKRKKTTKVTKKCIELHFVLRCIMCVCVCVRVHVNSTLLQTKYIIPNNTRWPAIVYLFNATFCVDILYKTLTLHLPISPSRIIICF